MVVAERRPKVVDNALDKFTEDRDVALERLKEVCGAQNIDIIHGDDEMPCCVIYNRDDRILMLRPDATLRDINDAKYLFT